MCIKVDILAIAPYYIALANPGGFVDQHDEQLRMIRIVSCRLQILKS
jgi:hypothetical protein